MTTLKRLALFSSPARAVHHVMARGDRREEIFRDDRDRWKFQGYLAEGVERYRVKVYCYVLMENHFHLVVMTPEGNLSQWMHQLKTPYTGTPMERRKPERGI